MKRTTILVGVAALGLVLAACASSTEGTHATSATSVVELRQDMRKLWEDHVTWTRMFIVSAAAALPDQKVAAERLLRNQDDIGDAIKPYYGDAAGEQLTTLLREHILIAADLLTAAKAGDTAAVEKTKTTWYANGEQIAGFLAQANPEHWPRAAVSHHMHTHLNLTLEEAVARLQGRYADDVAAYDKVHAAILEMADALSAGIVAQFPNKFA